MLVNEDDASQTREHVVEESYIDDVTLVTIECDSDQTSNEIPTDQHEVSQRQQTEDHEPQQESSQHEEAAQGAIDPQVPAPLVPTEATLTNVLSTPLPEVMSSPNKHMLAELVLLGSFALDLLLYSLVVPFLPKRAADLGASPLLTGILFSAYAAGLLCATPAAAVAVARIGSRTALLLGLFALLFSTICFAFASTLPLLFVARAVQGVSASITWIAGLALVAQIFDSRERSAVFGRIFAATGIGMLIGPPLGGFLYTFGGQRMPFVAAGVLVLLDGAGRIFFLPNPRRGRSTPEMQTPAVHGTNDTGISLPVWRTLPHTPDFALGLAATIAGAATFALIEPVLPLLLTRTFHLDTLMIGGIFGFAILVFTFAQPAITLVGRRAGGPVLIGFGLAVSPITLSVLAFSPNVLLAVAALGVLSIAVACVLAPALELLTATAANEARGPLASAQGANVKQLDMRYGAIYAAYNLAYASGLFLGPILSGTLTTVVGPSWGLTLPGIVPLLVGGISLGVWRAHCLPD